MLEGVKSRIARALLSEDDTKALRLGAGVIDYDFHGPNGTGSIVHFDGRGSLPTAQIRRETAYVVAAMCYAAINYRANNIAEAPLRVARLNLEEDSFEFVPHPLDRVLQEPSLDYDMAETLWLTVASLDIYARALWTKDDNRMDQLGRLFPWAGRDFSVEQAGGRVYGRFNLTNVAGGRDALAPEEVVHFKLLSPYNRYEGVSPVDAALGWLNLGADVEVSVRRMVLNGMFPSVVVSPDKDWDPNDEELERFKQNIARFATGPANHGKPFVNLGGGKVDRIAFSLKDLLPDQLMDRVEATVAMAFGIAPVVLGALVGLRNSPWSQFAEARRGTYDDTIVPLWMRLGRTTTRQLLRPIDSRLDHVLMFDTSKVAALQVDTTKRVADAQKATTWTLDERRAHSGQDVIGGEDGAWIEARNPPERRTTREDPPTDPPPPPEDD